MKLLSNSTLFRIYIILLFLNSIVLFGSQYFVYTKHWDLYWFSSFFYRELLLCVSYFLVFWFLSVLPKRLGVALAWIIFALSCICFIIDIFLLYTFDTNLNSYLVIVALETNPKESADFLHNYITPAICGIYAFFALCIFALWRIIQPISPSLKIAYALYNALGVGIGIILVMILTQTKPLNEDWSDMLYNDTRQIYRAIMNTRAFIEEYKKLNHKFDELAQSLEVQPTQNPIDNIVLVIGESTQRERLSLYGYTLPTTPLLEKLKHDKPQNLFIFNDVIAPHAQTHESLSLSLTFANQDSQGISTLPQKQKAVSPLVPLSESDSKTTASTKQWYEYLNIIDAFKLGGYHTIALSNQEPVSLFGNAAATILKRANEVVFVNINDKMSTTKFDESILDTLKLKANEDLVSADALQDSYHQNTSTQEFVSLESTQAKDSPQKTKKPTLYALHLMGNHAKYYNRYPTHFAHFAPKDMPCQEDNSPQKSAYIEENMHYDNSVLYGDFIVSEIFKHFAESDSIVIYFSDHGEEVYDWRSFIGHSDSKISRFMVEIPFIIYVSDSFIQKHPALYKRIQNASNQRYMNDDLIHTLLDIAGINLKGYEAKRSIFSNNKAFLNTRLRLVGEKQSAKDYDKELISTQSYIQQGLCESNKFFIKDK